MRPALLYEFVALVGCLAGCSATDQQQTRSQTQPIGNNGTVDSGGAYPYVGALLSQNALCSGTLVTPRWVLSAAHCFNGQFSVGVSTPVNFVLSPDPAAATASQIFAKSAVDAALRTSGSIDPYDPNDAPVDMALVNLERPVKPFITFPKHPPTSPGVCSALGEEFTGVLIGYGKGHPFCPVPSPEGVRRYSTVEGWGRFETNDGAAYGSQWDGLIPFFCDIYTGFGSGDSGGALLKADSAGTLCGVISTIHTAPIPQGWTAFNEAAGLDAQPTIDWVMARILDIDGNFDGECGPATPANDPDGDGIPTGCDSCPRVSNPEQLSMDDDPDVDGHGAACDFCPGLTVKNQFDNCNFESELAEAFPQATEVPLLKRSDFPAGVAGDTQFTQAKEYMLGAIRPNACDPVPCPTLQLVSGGNLPDNEYPALSADPTSYCNMNGCKWQAVNKIRIQPKKSTVIPGPNGTGATTGVVGLRWCFCNFADTGSLAGRVQCRSGTAQCVVSALEYTGSTAWKKIVTRADGGWSSPGTYALGKDLGQTWSLPVPGEPKDVLWDFLDLGLMYVDYSENSASTEGILWAHFESLANSYPELPTLAVTKFGNIYGAGDAEYYLETQGPPKFQELKSKYFCDGCPEVVLDLFSQEANPEIFMATQSGMRPLAVPAVLSEFYGRVASSPSVRYVTSAESPGRLWDQGGSRIEGVAIRTGMNGLTSKLVVGPAGGFPSVVPLSAKGGPEIFGNEGIVLAASEKRLFVIGGTTNGRIDGPANISAWLFDFPANTWRELALPAQERPVNVLAATFLLEDRAIYFVERTIGRTGPVLQLKRWNALHRHPDGGAVRTLASLPASWTAFERTWLVAGDEGDLLFAGSQNAKGAGSLFSRFSFDEGRHLSFRGSRSESVPLAAAPSLRAQAIEYTAGGAVPTHRTLSLANLQFPRSDVPVVY